MRKAMTVHFYFPGFGGPVSLEQDLVLLFYASVFKAFQLTASYIS